MPELPEVEIARRHLSRWIGGATVVRAVAPDAGGILDGSPAAFASALAKHVVKKVERRGKWLRLELAKKAEKGAERVLLFSHLGMTGKWVKRDATAPDERWERARIDVEKAGKKSSVRYVDPRRFGRMAVSRSDIASWSDLGPDPLADGIDVKRLVEKLGRRKLSVKEVLMDQSVLAGVGNIQATEALWRAKIDPRSRADALTPADVRTIARGIEWSIARTLADAEKHGDEIGYVSDADGDNPFTAYGRKGERCPRCRDLFIRYDLGGRTTTSCPGCQMKRATKGLR